MTIGNEETLGVEQAAVAADHDMLRIEDLSVAIDDGRGPKVDLLSGINLSLPAGGSLGIVGESGSGKSLLVRAIMGLLPEPLEVSSGAVVYRGKNLLRMRDDELRRIRGREIAHILADAKSQLNPVLKIGTLLADVIRAHEQCSDEEVAERSATALGRLSIPDPVRRLEAYPHELSGGMAQRVCIAMALTHDPDLIVADEPTAGLDVTVQRQVLDLMAAMVGSHQTAQLVVTRDLGIVAHYCDHMAVMREGRIVEQGATTQVFEEPQDSYTRALIDAVQVGGSKDYRTVGGTR